MPGGDRTGRWGLGPMSGRAAGLCAGYDAPGYARQFVGSGRGWCYFLHRGFGGGFGRCHRRFWRALCLPFGWWGARLTTARQREMIEEEIKVLEQEAEELKRIKEELEKGAADQE